MLRKLLLASISLFFASFPVHAIEDLDVGGIVVSKPGASVGGMSVREYTARWWEYVLETPSASNPTVDPNGQLYSPGPYTGNGVSFLYGTNDSQPVSRVVSVSAGTNLLVPLINWVNLQTDPAETAADLLTQLEPLVAGTTGLFVQINGVDFPGQPDALLAYRETFGLPGDQTFGVTFPDTDAVFDLNGFKTDLMVADGHWLLLKNVPAGPLTIRFGGKNALGNTVDVTYQVSVPEPATLALFGLAFAGLGFARRRV